MSYLTVRRRLRVIRWVLLVVIAIVWIRAGLHYGVLTMRGSGEDGFGNIKVDGTKKPVVISYQQAGIEACRAWTELTIEITRDRVNLPAHSPLNDVAIERTGRFAYIFQRPDGTTYGPAQLDFGNQTDSLIENYERMGIDIAGRSPGMEIFWLGILVSFGAGMLLYALGGVLAIGLVLFLTAISVWTRRRSYECPACGYDMRNNPFTGCPECGWGRESHEAVSP